MILLAAKASIGCRNLPVKWGKTPGGRGWGLTLASGGQGNLAGGDGAASLKVRRVELCLKLRSGSMPPPGGRNRGGGPTGEGEGRDITHLGKKRSTYFRVWHMDGGLVTCANNPGRNIQTEQSPE